jgi:hypothetical protein
MILIKAYVVFYTEGEKLSRLRDLLPGIVAGHFNYPVDKVQFIAHQVTDIRKVTCSCHIDIEIPSGLVIEGASEAICREIFEQFSDSEGTPNGYSVRVVRVEQDVFYVE